GADDFRCWDVLTGGVPAPLCTALSGLLEEGTGAPGASRAGAVLRYTCAMTASARRLLEDVLALPEADRLELASEIIASVDGPSDSDWEAAWLAELDD